MNDTRRDETDKLEASIDNLAKELKELHDFKKLQEGVNEQKQKYAKAFAVFVSAFGVVILSICLWVFTQYTGDIAVKTLVKFMGANEFDVRNLVANQALMREDIKFLMNLVK